MPPGGVGEQDCADQGHPRTTNHGGAPSHLLPPPPFPTKMQKLEPAASFPVTARVNSPSTGNGGCDEDAPPFPSTEKKQDHPVGSLPVDVLAGILSRVPYKSLCRFKCVSRLWLSLCSDHDIRKRCPQTLSGFFYNYRGGFKFHNLSGRGPPLVDPSLPFWRGTYDCYTVEQCCGSLLLCKCFESRHEQDEYDYVVCNSMTGQWTVLPPVVWQDQEDAAFVRFEQIMDMFLEFDPAIPSRFVVFVPLMDCFCEFAEMAIYSSDTGRWTTVQTEWGYKPILIGNSKCVFLNGTMHLATHYGLVVTVDSEGKVWREIEMPVSEGKVSREIEMPDERVSIGQSQGRLYAWQIDKDDDDDVQLYVWVLEDYASGNWTLKHTVAVSELFGRQRGEDDMSYIVFAMHPDCNCIFLTDEEEMAVAYDLDNQKVNVSCTFEEFDGVLPYIPCFEEWSSDPH